MGSTSYIYLVQDGEDRGTNIYKFGRTTQEGGDTRILKRIKCYSKGTIQHFLWRVATENLINIEEDIRHLFLQKYPVVRGREWFRGSVNHMKEDIDAVICKYPTFTDISAAPQGIGTTRQSKRDVNRNPLQEMPKLDTMVSRRGTRIAAFFKNDQLSFKEETATLYYDAASSTFHLFDFVPEWEDTDYPVKQYKDIHEFFPLAKELVKYCRGSCILTAGDMLIQNKAEYDFICEPLFRSLGELPNTHFEYTDSSCGWATEYRLWRR
jgi:hypothetical protein